MYSTGKLWEGDHHSGCPSASLANKTCSVPLSIQIVNSMRDGEVRNRTVIVFHRKFVRVLCVCAHMLGVCKIHYLIKNSIWQFMVSTRSTAK